MSFDVRREEVDEVGAWIASYASTVASQLAQVCASARRMQALDSFQGRAAESVKAYWGEAHVVCSQTLATALMELSCRYEEYMSGYGSVDGARDARFEESSLAEAYSRFSSSRFDFAGKARSLASATDPVADLIGGWVPSPGAVEGELAELADEARDLRFKVLSHEMSHSSAASAVEGFLDAARQAVASLGGGGAAGSYVAGSFLSGAWAPALEECMAESIGYQRARSGSYAEGMASLDQRRQDRYDEYVAAAALEREKQGWIKIGTTAFGLLAGAVVSIGTCGAAAPIVIGAMGIFAASDFVEGAQDVYYGSRGDIETLAFNPIRDTVFHGDQFWYDAASFLVTTAVAGAAAPAAAAVGAARATGTSVVKAAVPAALKGAAVEVGRDGSVMLGSAYAANKLTGGNQTAVQIAMIAGPGLAGAVGGKPKPHDAEGGAGPGPFKIEGLEPPEGFSKGPIKPPRPRTKAEILAANAAKGRAYAAEKFAEFKERYPNALSEVTIELDDGTRIRVDAMAVDEEGNVVIQEYKSSKEAAFTKNQKHAYRDDEGVLEMGGTIVGKKGVGAFGEGVRIEAGDRVRVIRPE